MLKFNREEEKISFYAVMEVECLDYKLEWDYAEYVWILKSLLFYLPSWLIPIWRNKLFENKSVLV